MKNTETRPCGTCQRPMRPFGTSVKEYPNTMSRRNKDTCSSCVAAQLEGRSISRQRFISGTPCLDCGRPMRPHGTRPANHPDTKVVHQGNGYCGKCYGSADLKESQLEHTKNRAHATLGEAPAGLDAIGLKQRADLDKYMAERRARRIPPEGLPIHIWIRRNQVAA